MTFKHKQELNRVIKARHFGIAALLFSMILTQQGSATFEARGMCVSEETVVTVKEKVAEDLYYANAEYLDAIKCKVAGENIKIVEQGTDETTIIEDSETPLSDGVVKTEGIYHELTAGEINLLEVVVQHEVGSFTKQYKTLVAELIYNRIKSDRYPDTVKGVLYQEGQFQGIERWYSPDFEVDEETRAVIREVFSKSETSHDATFYYNPALSHEDSVRWFKESGSVVELFQYTEVDWGVTYTTCFCKEADLVVEDKTYEI